MASICKRWLPLVAWVVLIFGLSSIPDLALGDMKFPEGTDKVVHFFEYLVLALLFYRGLSYDAVRFKLVLLIVTCGTAAGLAGLDELYQSYIPGRDSSFLDLMADFAGIAAGAAGILLYNLVKKNRKTRDEIQET